MYKFYQWARLPNLGSKDSVVMVKKNDEDCYLIRPRK